MAGFRTFSAPGRGGLGVDPKKTAVLFIEFQNEFTTKGGKLHPQVKEVMDSSGMLHNASQLAKEARAAGVKIFHAPISFAADGSDNPNKSMGILLGCDNDKLFTRGTWNAEICDPMKPAPEDVVVIGKRGLSAFPNTDLEEQLKSNNIETIALAGFMSNCCVESTMREACEKGFNIISLIDCVATTSAAGNKAAIEITYPFFSTPMNSVSFLANIKAASAIHQTKDQNEDTVCGQPQAKRARPSASHPDWAVRNLAPDVYQVGPWFVDVRQSIQGEKIKLRSGEHELTRYLTFAEASALPGNGTCRICDAIYYKKRPIYTDTPGESTEPFGWFSNMTVVRLPAPACGSLVYSPILGPGNSFDTILAALKEHNLLPVRFVVAPSPQHHLALSEYQSAFPDAFFICGKASGQMPPLTRKRRDLRFDGVISATPQGEAVLTAPICDQEGSEVGRNTRQTASWDLLCSVFQICIVDDNRSGEIVMQHAASKTLLISDLLYKSNPDIVGPGGFKNRYSHPDWFAEGQEELFYGHPQDNSGGLLPSYRTHPRMRSIDIPGMRRSLDTILSWDFDQALACHTDPLNGKEARRLIKLAWSWLWNEE
eukprot:TRINITY_DN32096_c0_g1_i1.p1 TRINITY_DN32096_c0_g1~~TRINITY_DN32096_c0_g1_i1.p1  ORF type:complete len:598 (-),score=71.58 TRINITY_DN32096_c0_g1_i1:94-1887(-)